MKTYKARKRKCLYFSSLELVHSQTMIEGSLTPCLGIRFGYLYHTVHSEQSLLYWEGLAFSPAVSSFFFDHKTFLSLLKSALGVTLSWKQSDQSAFGSLGVSIQQALSHLFASFFLPPADAHCVTLKSDHLGANINTDFLEILMQGLSNLQLFLWQSVEPFPVGQPS